MDDAASGPPSLADTIAAVRHELSTALATGYGQSARFRAGSVELDLEVAVTCTGDGPGGVYVSVLTLAGHSGLERAASQRIKVMLQPLDPDTSPNAHALRAREEPRVRAPGLLDETGLETSAATVLESRDGGNTMCAISEHRVADTGLDSLPAARQRPSMKLSEGTSVILFRFHDNLDLARERITILRHFNPDLAVHALFCGDPDGFAQAQAAVHGLVETTWRYPTERSKQWMWFHGDLVVKAWHRSIGSRLDFDFLYVHEYDLLFTEPLPQIYPDIDDRTLALTGCAPLTPELERNWQWTSQANARPRFVAFCRYLQAHFGLERPPTVCFGPGPLLPRTFLDTWCSTEDIDLVHEEISYPAYAAALGFNTVNTDAHPGMGQPPPRFFDCAPLPDTMDRIIHEATRPGGRRAFHPIKSVVTLAQLLGHPAS